jgi:WD40 repeat protein
MAEPAPIHKGIEPRRVRFARWRRRHPILMLGIVALFLAGTAALTMAAYVMILMGMTAKNTGVGTGIVPHVEAPAPSKAELAENALNRGIKLFEQNEVARGMLWMAQSLKIAPDGNPALERTPRANLARWRPRLAGIKAVRKCPHNVTCLAFSPDGKYVVTGGRDNVARVWEMANGKPVSPELAHRDYVICVAFSPDGKYVATGSRDNTARVWESKSGKPVGLPLEHRSWVDGVAFSPDGKYLLTGSLDNTARVWETMSGKPVGPVLQHQAAVRSVAFSPDGKLLLTATFDGTVLLWDRFSSTLLGTPIRQEHVECVAFSPDGKYVLTGSGNHSARLWETATGKPVGPTLEHGDTVFSVAFSPDGKYALTGSADHMARLWETATGKQVGTPLEHPDTVFSVAFSPDCRIVWTGCDDNALRTWETPGGNEVINTGSKHVGTGKEDNSSRPLQPPPPWEGTPERIALTVTVLTGLELDDKDTAQLLDPDKWQQRRQQLDKLGGPVAP